MTDFSSSLRRVLDTNSPQTSFTVAAGYKASFPATSAYARVPVADLLAGIVSFYGTGDANDAFDCRIYGEYGISAATPGSTRGPTTESTLVLLGTATATLGTATGASGATIVPAASLIADTISWSASAFLLAAETAFSEGASGVASPADNTQAFLFLPCLARCSSLLFEFDATTGTPTGMNALFLGRQI